jgi:FKBP-type peptidyl-prolyl cis-trans isomerase FklB
MREVIGAISLQGLVTDRDAFSDQIQQKAAKDMAKLGLEILSCNIKNINDQNGLINDLGADNTWKIKKDAAINKANAEKEGVVVLPSGLQYKVINEGTGKKPSATSQVRCHYEGTFLNGAKFDSSYDRNEPAVFGLNQVIAGWTEGVQLMAEGAKYEFYIPYNLAYGEHGAPGAIPPYATLKFVVELIEVL